MEEKEYARLEKRMSPRVSTTGKLIFKACREPEYEGQMFHEDPYVPADLLEMSMDGMRIRTSVPLEEKNLLEINRDYQVTQVALVRWVKKMESCYHAGLLYINQ